MISTPQLFFQIMNFSAYFFNCKIISVIWMFVVYCVLDQILANVSTKDDLFVDNKREKIVVVRAYRS
jgi:hypothetical protein